ncbi:winged helix-turn-helix transcriptional regulator [bacterium]|nr:winged helix-turn-helix transcriptional regulator [bacterium]
MSALTTSDYSRETSILKALANEARLKIVHHLDNGESCVCDLVELVGLDQSTVSKHLAVLKAAAIVDRERRGHHIYYRLVAPCVLDFIACAAAVAADRGAGTTADPGTGSAGGVVSSENPVEPPETCDGTPPPSDRSLDGKGTRT